MFINCRHCHALVATDPATDLPPERCPRCAGVLRRSDVATPAAVPQTAPTPSEDAPADGAFAEPAPTPDPAPRVETVPDLSALLRPAPAPRMDGPTGLPSPAPDTSPAPDPAQAATQAPAGPVAPLHAAAAAAISGAASPASAAPADDPPASTADADANASLARDRPVDLPPSGAATSRATPPHVPAGPAQAVAVPDADPQGPVPHGASGTSPPAAGPGFLAGQASGTRAADPRRRIRRIAAIVALLALLAVQVLLADRARLAADPRWRPIVDAACGVVGCSLPPWREPAAFALVSREVRPHPQVPGALRVRATVRNDARWPQAWPQLVLTLSDVDGRAVAARAFAPGDYLADGAPSMLAAGQSRDIQLDIREPSAATVSYAFDFRD
ncbi:DUF3426 domain-containing protein [Luteimonas kalidii]|uniref:DUF3426 domain-containing protein n=1 Tax=Luteimonas kalidii TaxID=3042025 RepID=A0ABT6JUN0_9GAMM|nr:DUF3426 domain-containing protein [Luteimonas kalidii]MDH5834393.1 DUF3426 domain-containing protein [Luteimonas kalidii]